MVKINTRGNVFFLFCHFYFSVLSQVTITLSNHFLIASLGSSLLTFIALPFHSLQLKPCFYSCTKTVMLYEHYINLSSSGLIFSISEIYLSGWSYANFTVSASSYPQVVVSLQGCRKIYIFSNGIEDFILLPFILNDSFLLIYNIK